jgi:hypothetical protein
LTVNELFRILLKFGFLKTQDINNKVAVCFRTMPAVAKLEVAKPNGIKPVGAKPDVVGHEATKPDEAHLKRKWPILKPSFGTYDLDT